MTAPSGRVVRNVRHGTRLTVVPQLKALGRAMIENEPPQGSELEVTGNSTIPPVYTYWGQFIDHDITLNMDSNESVSDITQSDLPRSRPRSSPRTCATAGSPPSTSTRCTATAPPCRAVHPSRQQTCTTTSCSSCRR